MKSIQAKCIFLIYFFLIAGVLSAQELKYNRISMEVTTGIHIPFSPRDNINEANYIAFKQFQVAGRYMFSQKLGLKGHYGYNYFSNSENSNEGISANRIAIEGVANIGKLLNVDYKFRKNVGLLVHAGGGITFSKPIATEMHQQEPALERTGNLMAGLTAQVKLSERFALLGDLTYVANFSQDYDYNGALLDPQTNSGGLMNISIGIMYVLGSERIHADWY